MRTPGRAISILIALALLVPGLAGLARAEGAGPTVVELYTSQGCSSCPPADAFLGELAERHDVLALAFHVDYWDYIGWKDAYASPEFTRRQRDYARYLRKSYVYTPQMVIQGHADEAGSRRRRVLALIERAKSLDRHPVALERQADGTVAVSIPSAPVDEEVAVVVAVYDRMHETVIKRGENAGRTLRYHNVVRQLRRIGTWRGEALRIPVPPAAVEAGDGGCAVLLQSVQSGRILGAADMAFTPSN